MRARWVNQEVREQNKVIFLAPVGGDVIGSVKLHGVEKLRIYKDIRQKYDDMFNRLATLPASNNQTDERTSCMCSRCA